MGKAEAMVSVSGAGMQGIMTVFAEFGTVVQLLVLLSLLIASVVCWGIIFQKARLLRKIRSHSVRFLDALYTANDLAFTAAAARLLAQIGARGFERPGLTTRRGEDREIDE